MTGQPCGCVESCDCGVERGCGRWAEAKQHKAALDELDEHGAVARLDAAIAELSGMSCEVI